VGGGEAKPHRRHIVFLLISGFGDGDTRTQMKLHEYQDYLKSEAWQGKRKLALERAKYACQLCSSPNNLQVHHRTYERIGNELLEDLTVLCDGCHKHFHGVDSGNGRPLHKPKKKGKKKSSKKKPKNKPKNKPTPSVRWVRRFLEENVGRSFTVKELIEQSPYTPGQINGAVGSLNQKGEIRRVGKDRWTRA